jgi:hypothetical protein
MTPAQDIHHHRHAATLHCQVEECPAVSVDQGRQGGWQGQCCTRCCRCMLAQQGGQLSRRPAPAVVTSKEAGNVDLHSTTATGKHTWINQPTLCTHSQTYLMLDARAVTDPHTVAMLQRRGSWCRTLPVINSTICLPGCLTAAHLRAHTSPPPGAFCWLVLHSQQPAVCSAPSHEAAPSAAQGCLPPHHACRTVRHSAAG